MDVHGIDFPQVQGCLIPGIPVGQAANGLLCGVLTALPSLWAPLSKKPLLHSPVCISGLTQLLWLIFYLLHPHSNELVVN